MSDEYVEFNSVSYFNTYNVIALDDYRTFAKSNIVNCTSIEELSNYIDINNKLNKTCFEVLKNDVLRIFLDIENIEVDKPEIYKQIINDFIRYTGLNQDTVKYVVTFNKGSHHEGLSYHVIFHAVTTINNLRNTVTRFKLNHPEYERYVDTYIYTSLRLFRLPYQYGLIKKSDPTYKDTYNPVKDYHKIFDKLHIDNVTINDYVIQNIDPSQNVVFGRMYRPIPSSTQPAAITTTTNIFSGAIGDNRSEGSSVYRTFVNIFNSLNPFK